MTTDTGGAARPAADGPTAAPPSPYGKFVEGALLIYSFVIGTGLNDLWTGKEGAHDFVRYVIALFWLISFAVGARSHLDREFSRGKVDPRWLIVDLLFVVLFGTSMKAASTRSDVNGFFFFGMVLFSSAVLWFVICAIVGRKGHRKWSHFLAIDLNGAALCLFLFLLTAGTSQTGVGRIDRVLRFFERHWQLENDQWLSFGRYIAMVAFVALSVCDLTFQIRVLKQPFESDPPKQTHGLPKRARSALASLVSLLKK